MDTKKCFKLDYFSISLDSLPLLCDKVIYIISFLTSIKNYYFLHYRKQTLVNHIFELEKKHMYT